jgi:hypothetical protein
LGVDVVVQNWKFCDAGNDDESTDLPPFLIIICLMLCLICNYFSLQFPYCREAKSKDFFQGWLKRYEVFSSVIIPMSFAWISCPSHTKYAPHPNHM